MHALHNMVLCCNSTLTTSVGPSSSSQVHPRSAESIDEPYLSLARVVSRWLPLHFVSHFARDAINIHVLSVFNEYLGYRLISRRNRNSRIQLTNVYRGTMSLGTSGLHTRGTMSSRAIREYNSRTLVSPAWKVGKLQTAVFSENTWCFALFWYTRDVNRVQLDLATTMKTVN